MIDPMTHGRAVGLLLALICGGALAVAGCGSEATGAGAAPALPTDGRWSCATDADCINSCALGAVAGAWYRRHERSFVECDDGCDNQISGPPRCIDGGCVAFDDQGARRDYCTRKTDR